MLKQYRPVFFFFFIFLLIQCTPNDPTRTNAYPPPLASYPGPGQSAPVIVGRAKPVTVSVPLVTLPTTPASDFAFLLRFGSCGTDSIDTFTHSFTKDMLVSPSVTISLTLSNTDMVTIYQKMAAINLFGYPARYDTTDFADATHAIVMPSENYTFIVQNNGHTTSVAWTDNVTPPPTDEAKRLQELAQLITSRVNAYPEVKRLPAPKAACA